MNNSLETQKTQRALRAQGFLMIILLAVQYILGMINNFFVDFPQSGQPEVVRRHAASQASEIVHIFHQIGFARSRAPDEPPGSA